MDFIGYKTGIVSIKPAIAFFDFLDFTGLPVAQEISPPHSPDVVISSNGE